MEMSDTETKIYQKYIMEELKEENIEIMRKELMDKIKCAPPPLTSV